MLYVLDWLFSGPIHTQTMTTEGGGGLIDVYVCVD
jgi:hypothetical protein